jgi:hypothetical protein
MHISYRLNMYCIAVESIPNVYLPLRCIYFSFLYMRNSNQITLCHLEVHSKIS